MASEPGRVRGEGPAAWLAAAGFLACGVVATSPLALSPRPGGPVAALFPPWWDASRAFEATVRAHAVMVRAGAWPALVVAADAVPQPVDPGVAGGVSDAGVHGVPGLGARLRAAGAWLILDPQSLRGCSLLPGPP